jgi:DNA-nicking Smr family endonuclease
VAASKKRKRGGPFDALGAMKDELAARAAKEKTAPPKKPEQVPPNRALSEPAEDEALLFHRLLAGVTPLDRSRGRVPKERGERSDSEATPSGFASADHAAARADGPSATPLRARTLAERAEHGRQTEQAEADAVHNRLRELVEGSARFEVADDGWRVEGRRVDLPIDALRRLRRGLLPVDARLDLHGMGVREARAQLELFLRTMRSRGERCVLVIHGKGEHSPQGVGVLRGEMAAWLSQGASSQHVAAFVTAREGDGGQGAVYVLLRR